LNTDVVFLAPELILIPTTEEMCLVAIQRTLLVLAILAINVDLFLMTEGLNSTSVG
jgi:hypothetical protein